MSGEMIGHERGRLQSRDALSIVLAGDLVLDVPEPDHWLSGIAPALQAADLAIGHLEVPHTRRGREVPGDVPAPGADPAHLAALARAGFDAVSMAGNHMADCGPEGIVDSCVGLDALGIVHAGAGLDLASARRPVVIGPPGRRVALLSYNCVGPEFSWATTTRAGCAGLRMETSDGKPVTPLSPMTRPTDEAIEMLREDVAAAKRHAELVIVALHKGIVHTPARLAEYERPVAQAAVDAGADVVVGHHAHIIRGLERYRGAPIFHGLGNGCVVTHALSPGQGHAARDAWAARRKALFGFEPDPAYALAPFHPEAVNAMLGRLLWHADGRLEAGLLPVHVEPPGRPVLADGAPAEMIRAYVEHITKQAGLPPVSLEPRQDMMLWA